MLKMKRVTFTKKASKQTTVSVPGTRTSSSNGLLLISTGIPSLDHILGGGLPVGSILIVGEDTTNRFSNLMIKYYLAEGLVCGHDIFMVSRNENSQEIIQQLPKPVLTEKESNHTTGDMNIAFRYQDLPKASTSLSNISKYGHNYDISKIMESSVIDNGNIDVLNICGDASFHGKKSLDIFRYAFLKVKEKANNMSFTVPNTIDPEPKVNILRVTIPGLGSPLWCDPDMNNVHRIARFLHCLRALARTCLMTCMITIPTDLYNEPQLQMLQQLSDCMVELQSFEGEEKNPAYKQYHGLFKIKKLPCLNSLVSFVPDSFDLAFELKKTKFVIECLHLPPDISETAIRQGVEDNEMTKMSNLSCGGSRNKLDF